MTDTNEIRQEAERIANAIEHQKRDEAAKLIESAIHTYRKPLIEALKKYGHHKYACLMWTGKQSLQTCDGSCKCNCGLSEILDSEEQSG